MLEIKRKMKDGGLEWNRLKSKIIVIKKGVIDTSLEECVLDDGTKIECLNSEQKYKFLGVPENILHKVDDLVTGLREVIAKRANIIWTSPLSDYNRIIATNIFVHSSVEYYMMSEKFNLGHMREFDTLLRKIMNEVHSKYSLQLNESLYLPRSQGGRGLKNFENLYKKNRIKAAMYILTTTDSRIAKVKEFDQIRMKENKSSITKDAIKFAEEDFDVKFVPLENDFSIEFIRNEETLTTSKKHEVKKVLKQNETQRLKTKICLSTWQGIILKTRYNDAQLVTNKCFTWLSRWKDCPTETINEIHSNYLQTVPTLTFKKFRGEGDIRSSICRLCDSGVESVKHLLSNCKKFLATNYKRRHDRALQLVIFKFFLLTNTHVYKNNSSVNW